MIRKARKSDLEQIYKLIVLGGEMGKVVHRSKNDVQRCINTFFVYLKNGKIVGCCSLEVYGKKLSEVRSLVVLPAYQGQGIGSELVVQCIKEAGDLGIYEVLAITDQKKLFSRLGFKKDFNNQSPMIAKPKEMFGDILKL